MHKRRLLGILKYGKRLYSKEKFQQGGTITAASTPYDWRDDPYEKQIAAERLQRDKAAAAAKNKATTDYKFDSSFTPLKGGLSGSLSAAKDLFAKEQDGYFAKVSNTKFGIDWANSVAGKREYQRILAYGAELQSGLTNEKAIFDKAVTSLETGDGEVMAISGGAEGSMFVQEFKKFVGEDGKEQMSRAYKEIPTQAYQANLLLADNDPKKIIYAPQTVNTFVKWKRSIDKSRDSALINKYLTEGSASMETFYKENAVQLLKSANYSIDTKANTLMGTGDETVHLDVLQNSIKTMLGGGSGDGAQILTTKDVNNNAQVKAVIDNIYGKTLQSGIGSAKRMQASLRADALATPEVAAYGKKLAASGKKPLEQLAMMELFVKERMKISLVNRLVFAKHGKLTSETSGVEGIGGITNKPHNDIIAASIQANILAGDKNNPNSFEKEVTVNGETRVISTTMPGISDAIPNTKLELATQPTIGSNAILTSSANTSKMYLQNGEELNGIFGNMAKDGVPMRSRMVISKNAAVDVVYLPTIKGKPVPDFFNQESMSAIKISARKEYIKSSKAAGNDMSGINAEDLLPNDLGNPAALKGYQEWIAMGENVDQYKKIAATAKKGKDKTKALKDLKMAKDAMRTINVSMGKIAVAIGDKKIIMAPYASVSVIVNDDDSYNIADVIKKTRDGKLIVRESSSAEKSYMRDEVSKLPGYENVADAGTSIMDDYVSFKTFIPLNTPTLRKGDNSARENILLTNIEDKVIEYVTSMAISGDPTASQTVKFLSI